MKLATLTEKHTGADILVNPEAVMLVVTSDDNENSNVFFYYNVGGSKEGSAISVKGTAEEVKKQLGAMAAARKTKG